MEIDDEPSNNNLAEKMVSREAAGSVISKKQSMKNFYKSQKQEQNPFGSKVSSLYENLDNFRTPEIIIDKSSPEKDKR